MKDFLIIFKTLYKNGHAKQVGANGKKKLPPTLTFVLSCFPLVLIACAVLAFMCIGINNTIVLASMMGLIVLAGQSAVLFLSMSAILNTLYSSRDTAMFNTLPIKPSSVFFAKLLICYVDLISLSSLIIIPALLTVSITFNVVNGSIFYGIYPLIIIIALIAPILPLFLIILFSMPLNYVGTFFKGKSTLKTVLSLIIYIVLIGGYMAIVFYLNTSAFGQNGAIAISNNSLETINTVAKVMYPNYVLISFALGINFGINFGISIAITIGMIIVLLLLSTLFYKKINQKHLETISNNSHKEDTQYKQQSIVKSLIARDFKLIMRNQYIAITTFANLLVCPIVIIVEFFINANKGSDLVGVSAQFSNMGFLIMFSMIFVCGINSPSMIAYTREGEAFVVTKTLPIKAKDSIIAKVVFSMIFEAFVIVIVGLISILLYKIDIVSTLVICLSIIISSIGYSCLHIFYDMKNGNIHWKTNQDLKQVSGANKGTLLAVFSAVIPGVIMFVFGIFIQSKVDSLGVLASKAIYLSLFFAISLIATIIGVIALTKNGEKLFYSIGDKKFVSKSSYKTNSMRGI